MLTRKRFREDPEASFYSERRDGDETLIEYRDRNRRLHNRDGPARIRIENGYHTEEQWLHGSTQEVDRAIPTAVVFHRLRSSMVMERYCHRRHRYDIYKSLTTRDELRYSTYDNNHILQPLSGQRIEHPELQKYLRAYNREVVEQFDDARQEVSLVLLPDLANIVLDYLIVLPFPECPTTTSAASV